MSARESQHRRLRVLFSFGRPHAKSNPFLPMLLKGIGEDADVYPFSWKFALLGRYDVLHFHWPEHWFQQTSGWRRYVRFALVRLVMLRTDLRRTLVVTTVHNVTPHERLSRMDQHELDGILRRIDMWVVMNPFTPTPDAERTVLAPHGHYRDWYSAHHATTDVSAGPRESILFAGFIRPYKGVEGLIDEYRAADITLPLRVMGKPHSAELAAELERLAGDDERVSLVLDHVDDEALADELARAGLLVLPYRAIHNSGIALLALSFNRPILVPENEVSRALQEEFGREYVHLFSDSLTGERLREVVAAVGSTDWRAVGPADMSGREWSSIGATHRAAYLAALARRRT